MVRRGSSVRVRHWALSFCRQFLRGSAAPPRPEVQNGYVRPPAGPSRPTAGAPATQSPKAARRADPERSERVDGGDGRRHTATNYSDEEGARSEGGEAERLTNRDGDRGAEAAVVVLPGFDGIQGDE